MIVSRNPLGLSVLAEEVTGNVMSFTRNGRHVRAKLMTPHTGFGESRWWEPTTIEVASWWAHKAHSSTTLPALRVSPDGSTSVVATLPHGVDLGKSQAARLHACRVEADAHTVTYVPIAEKYPAAFPASLVGTLLVAAGRADSARSGSVDVYETTSDTSGVVHGDVVLCPDSSGFDLVEQRVATAMEWAQAPATNPAKVAIAIRNGVAPSVWFSLESAAEEMLRRYAQGIIPSGPIWDAVLSGFMSAITEDGVRTPEELRTQHADYCDVTRHLSVGGNADELVHSMVPRWMRHPLDLSAEVCA